MMEALKIKEEPLEELEEYVPVMDVPFWVKLEDTRDPLELKNVKKEELEDTQTRVTFDLVPALKYEIDSTTTSSLEIEDDMLDLKDLKEEVEMEGIEEDQNSASSFGCGDICISTTPVENSLEEQYQCELCDLKCVSEHSLSLHINKHFCKEYDSNYAQKNMKQLMKPHIKCIVCDAKLAHKGDLKRHMRTHTGDKPFNCNLCDLKFARKSTLVRHTATHTGDKPFICFLCDKKFARKSNIVSHMRVHNKR